MQNHIHILTDRLKINFLSTLKFPLLCVLMALGTPLITSAYSAMDKPRAMECNKSGNFVEPNKSHASKAPLATTGTEGNPLELDFFLSTKSVTVNFSKPSENSMMDQQNGRISGKIIDEKGESLPGASIKIVELNKFTISSVDGSYEMKIPPGTYTVEVSYISFQTKRVSDVTISNDKETKLNVVLNPANNALKEVVIKSSFKKESVEGLFAQQKNAAAVTDGISAEQIARTPDNTVASSLKRISGLTLLDNKYVVVRGLTERYNLALVDGVTIPNTDMNRRNFSFDILPTELVSSIVVNKTATPDMLSEFVGGQIIINTLALPNSNFTTISMGAGYNDITTGKDFLSAGGRGKSDYFGYDDGKRKLPTNLVSWDMANQQDDPRIETVNEWGHKTGYAGAIEQSKRFDADGFKRYKYTAAPNQNYRATLGRLYVLNQEKGTKIGFIAGVNYRNTQQANQFKSAREFLTTTDQFMIESDTLTTGTTYSFKNTLGGILNAGLHSAKFKLNLKNIYTRLFHEDFYFSRGRESDNKIKQEYNFVDPVFSTLLQHKIEGEHSLGQKGFKIDWSLGYSGLDQEHKDTRQFTYSALENTFGTYYQRPNITTRKSLIGNYSWDYRFWTTVKQNDYNWALNLSYPFQFLKGKSLVKSGYMGWYKKRTQDVLFAKIYRKDVDLSYLITTPYDELLTPDKVGYGNLQAYYFMDVWDNGSISDIKSKYHGAYLMLDQQFFANKLRLVYGVRAENFNLADRQLAELNKYNILKARSQPGTTLITIKPELTGETNWNFLPSASLIFSPTEKTNIRAAFSKTMIRPDFRETSTFEVPDPVMQATIQGGNISSTKIENYDLRLEYYPSPGEILSISGFYKYIDRPVELEHINQNASGVRTLKFKNQHSAENLGVEVELRKSFNFISESLANLTVFGNAAYIWSEVKTLSRIINPKWDAANPNKPNIPKEIDVIEDYKRPLIGQSPYIINAGLSYQSNFVGATASLNRSGYRSYFMSNSPITTEFQRARTLVDLQLRLKILKQKAEITLNVANLLNTSDEFYQNLKEWQPRGYPDPFNKNEKLPPLRIKGTNNYEPENGDRLRYRTTYGRTYNLAFTYTF